MNWLQKISQQMMFDFPDLAYYQSFGDVEYQGSQCAYCGKVLEDDDRYEDIWVLSGEKGTPLQFNFDQQAFLTKLEAFFPLAEAYLQQKASEPPPNPYGQHNGTNQIFNEETATWEDAPIPGTMRWDVPLQYPEKSQIPNDLKVMFHQTISSGEHPTFGTFGTDQYGSMIDRIFADSMNFGGTLGELRGGLNTLRDKIPYFVEALAKQYGSKATLVKSPVCIECAEENLVECENCGEMVDYNDAVETKTGYPKKSVYYCEECENETTECEWCGERVSNDDIRYIGPDDTYEGTEYTLCESCSDNSDWTYCDHCNRYITNEYNVHCNDYECGCPDCVGNADSMDLDHYNGVLRELGLRKRGGLPLTPDKVKKFYIPFFERYLSKFGSRVDESGRLDKDHVLAMAQRQNVKDPEMLKTLQFLIGKQPEEILPLLQQTVEFHEEFKKKYPKVKGVSNIPANFKVVPSYGDPDVPHMTITMSPSKTLLEFAEFMFPNAQQIWDRIKSGHHSGSIAYARIGTNGEDDEDTWLINNIQSDADLQSLSESDRGTYQEIWQKYAQDPNSVDLESGVVQNALAAGFWNKTFRNWQAILIDVVRQVALAEKKTLYMTSMEIQKARWSRIPERSREAYERIPLQMGGEEETAYVKPQNIREDNWDVIRLANWLQRISGGNKYTMSRRWNMSPRMTEEALNWLGTLGYGEHEVGHLTLDDIRRLAIL